MRILSKARCTVSEDMANLTPAIFSMKILDFQLAAALSVFKGFQLSPVIILMVHILLCCYFFILLASLGLSFASKWCSCCDELILSSLHLTVLKVALS